MENMEYVVEFTELVKAIKWIALQQAPVQSAIDGDVYENWNSAEIKYGSVNIGLENVLYNDHLTTYRFILYYGDRLLQDKSNVNAIYADGIRTLQTIVNNLNSIHGVEAPEQVEYTPFEQKFMDYLAGVYATVDVTTESVLGECANLLSSDWRLGMALPGTLS